MTRDADGLDPECDKNVFQLWKEVGEKLPFKVVRWNWHEPNSGFLVESIEIRKWPYGKAWGRAFRNGVFGREEELGCAGCYQWKIVP